MYPTEYTWISNPTPVTTSSITADRGSSVKDQSTLSSLPSADRPIGIQEPSVRVTRCARASTAAPGEGVRLPTSRSATTAPSETRNDRRTAPQAITQTAFFGKKRAPRRPLRRKPATGNSGTVQSSPMSVTPGPQPFMTWTSST